MSGHRSKLIRIAKVTAGVALLLLGVVMLVTPGPGIPVVVSSLVLLQDDFDWAKSALDGITRLTSRSRSWLRSHFATQS